MRMRARGLRGAREPLVRGGSTRVVSTMPSNRDRGSAVIAVSEIKPDDKRVAATFNARFRCSHTAAGPLVRHLW